MAAKTAATARTLKENNLILHALAQIEHKDEYPCYPFDWALHSIGEVIEEEGLDPLCARSAGRGGEGGSSAEREGQGGGEGLHRKGWNEDVG